VAVGNDLSMQNLFDAAIVKYDFDGNVIWKNSFGGELAEFYNSVTAVPDGIVAVGVAWPDLNGGTFADLPGLPGKGGYDAFIVKYNSDGSIAWKQNFGGSGHDCFYSVTAVPDGIVAVGYSTGASFGNGDWEGFTRKGGQDAIIVKYNFDGSLAWKKNFGGNESDNFHSVITVSDGIVAAGFGTVNGSGDWARLGKNYNYDYLDGIIVKFGTGDSGIADKVISQNRVVYPNPANSQLHVASSHLQEDAVIEIYDIMGNKQKAEIKKAVEEITLDIPHLPSGIYFLKINNATVKVVKK